LLKNPGMKRLSLFGKGVGGNASSAGNANNAGMLECWNAGMQ